MPKRCARAAGAGACWPGRKPTNLTLTYSKQYESAVAKAIRA